MISENWKQLNNKLCSSVFSLFSIWFIKKTEIHDLKLLKWHFLKLYSDCQKLN
jgi:hypothetical protein